jgi:hypothetical protein
MPDIGSPFPISIDPRIHPTTIEPDSHPRASVSRGSVPLFTARLIAGQRLDLQSISRIALHIRIIGQLLPGADHVVPD